MRELEVFPSIVKNAEVSHKQGSNGEKFFMHIHSHYEIYFSQSDNNKFFVDNKIYDVQKNDLFLFNNTDAHKIATSSIEDYERYVVNFSPKVVTKYDQSMSFLLDCFANSTSSRRHKLSLSDTETQTFLSIVNKMIDLNGNDTPHKYIKMDLFLLQLLLFIYDCFDTKSDYNVETNEDPILDEIMKYIQENYSYAISLDMLSDKFSFNKYYLCHIFKSKMGFGISDYIKSCRLSKALPLLQEGMPVSTVALKTGFGSDTYFISTFKKNFGTSPKQYTKNYKMQKRQGVTMNNLVKLCKEIDIPAQVEEILLRTQIPFDEKQTDLLISQLTNKDQYSIASKWLKQFDWFVQLKVMLMAGLATEKQYELLGIDHLVFVDTLKCFSRFINEHKISYGEYGFNRGFWVGRQLSCVLFRLGELEFELSTLEEKLAISIHIPSDSDLTPSKLDESFAIAKQFFANKFEKYSNVPFFCYSWLVSPNLKLVLPETSKIVMFQNRFDNVKLNEDNTDYVQWVFKDKNLSPQDFPENTSLQINIKRHILNGGKIGEALGILK